MTQPSTDGVYRCSFCGKREREVERVLAGPGVYICDECVGLYAEILTQDATADTPPLQRLPRPTDLYDHLDQYVIGQDHAKVPMSVAVYNHYKRTLADTERLESSADDGPEPVGLPKSNILLSGPTGSGKTLLAKTLSQILHVPFAIADATTLSEAGYVGEDVQNVLTRLLHAADYDVSSAERGIVYIDEVDKLAKRGPAAAGVRDVSGEGVQQSLLKMLEGTVALVPRQSARRGQQEEMIEVDTSHILFILGGAFEGLDEIVQESGGSEAIGFDATVEEQVKEDERSSPSPEDLVTYGMIPELVGRLQVIVSLDRLDREDLIRCLTEPRNSVVQQYTRLFELDGVKLVFTDEALEEIANESIERDTGARGLHSIVEQTLTRFMFHIPPSGTTLTVDAEMVRNRADGSSASQQEHPRKAMG